MSGSAARAYVADDLQAAGADRVERIGCRVPGLDIEVDESTAGTPASRNGRWSSSIGVPSGDEVLAELLAPGGVPDDVGRARRRVALPLDAAGRGRAIMSTRTSALSEASEPLRFATLT